MSLLTFFPTPRGLVLTRRKPPMPKTLFEKWNESEDAEKDRVIAECIISHEYKGIVLCVLDDEGNLYFYNNTNGVPGVTITGMIEELKDAYHQA